MPAKEPFTPCPIDLDLAPSPSSPDAMLESAQMAEVERLCRAAMPEVVGALIGIATGTRRKSKPNTDGIFETELNDEGKPILENWTAGPRVTAGNAVLQYGYGRPTQKVNLRRKAPSVQEKLRHSVQGITAGRKAMET